MRLLVLSVGTVAVKLTSDYTEDQKYEHAHDPLEAAVQDALRASVVDVLLLVRAEQDNLRDVP